jgi:hypothetical protein
LIAPVTKVVVRYVSTPPDVAARNRAIILKLQVQSILAAAKANATPSGPEHSGDRGTS